MKLRLLTGLIFCFVTLAAHAASGLLQLGVTPNRETSLNFHYSTSEATDFAIDVSTNLIDWQQIGGRLPVEWTHGAQVSQPIHSESGRSFDGPAKFYRVVHSPEFLFVSVVFADQEALINPTVTVAETGQTYAAFLGWVDIPKRFLPNEFTLVVAALGYATKTFRLVSETGLPFTLAVELERPFITLTDALEAPSVTWTTAGNAPWLGVWRGGEADPVNRDQARSGSISHGQESTLSADFTGPALVRFDYSVSSERGFDIFKIALDATTLTNISGESAGFGQAVLIPSGAHNLSFSYSKNDSVAAGRDMAILNNVRIETISGGLRRFHVKRPNGFPLNGAVVATPTLFAVTVDGYVDIPETELPSSFTLTVTAPGYQTYVRQFTRDTFISGLAAQMAVGAQAPISLLTLDVQLLTSGLGPASYTINLTGGMSGLFTISSGSVGQGTYSYAPTGSIAQLDMTYQDFPGDYDYMTLTFLSATTGTLSGIQMVSGVVYPMTGLFTVR